MPVIAEKDAVHHTREGVRASYYQFPDISEGTTVATATFTGPHGERTLGDHPRVYVVTEGKGDVTIDKQVTEVRAGDVIAIPPYATYDLVPRDGKLSVILFMELIDTTKLPK